MKDNGNYVIDVHQRSVVVSEDVVGSLLVTVFSFRRILTRGVLNSACRMILRIRRIG